MLATVAPQHLYGLLFRVLWPLAAGRPFLRSAVLHPEELAPYAGSGAPFALASTPLILRHVVEKRVLADCAEACRAVYSSGGPLQAEWARGLAEQLGAPPWEVYGSTETGGVAVRRQARGGEAWRSLPGVRVERAGECLVVDSPFVSVGAPGADGRSRYQLGDRAVFEADGGFHLRGRADRVVKVGEKRLSLSEMEARLRVHSAVADVALVGLGDEGETRVGAVLVPAAAGREIVAAGGRRALAKVLTEHLAAEFDRVLLPRAWRVVDALPRDAQGKSPAAALRGLFAPGTEGGRGAARPGEGRQGTELLERLRIPGDLPFLEGHFPGRPLVAGVVQVHFVMAAVEQLLGRAPRLESLERLKFRELLMPGQEVLLHVQLDPREDGDRFGFSLVDAAEPARVFSSGRGRLATDEPADS
jgi:acyl-coenzyme A synthetase/AMP-(fatty) acid ligase